MPNQADPSSTAIFAVREEFTGGHTSRRGAGLCLADLAVEVRAGSDTLWCVLRRGGTGGIALRLAHPGSMDFTTDVEREGDAGLRIVVDSALGRHRIAIDGERTDLDILRVRQSFTPAANMRIMHIPRGLIVLGPRDDPLAAKGEVRAAQRGMNAALVYFHMEKPARGSALYFQNLTALNPYFAATGTKPDGVVGGEWPELGYLIPTCENQTVEDPGPMKAGEEIVLSDAFLVLRQDAADDEVGDARDFLHMLAAVYARLDQPPVAYHDWTARAGETLRDLAEAPEARRRFDGNDYVLPYPEGEQPDAMVQLSILQAVHEYGRWCGDKVPLEARLRRGVARFHDAKRGMMQRFVPGMTGGKNPDEVDSWYLYHPLLNLGRLARDGDAEARDLLLASVDYAIAAAQRFEYHWPITFRAADFSVIEKARGDGEHGQTDVGGIYAFVMTQCFELTGDARFLNEARAAIDAARGLRFDLLYQSNLTAWGAVACLRLWRILDRPEYLAQSYAYLAGFFHNSVMWESDIGAAAHYPNFLGVTVLHDAKYMAMYECFESFVAFDEYLAQAGPGLDAAVRMLVSEYCKHALHRAWFYFPAALPREIIHEGEHQSGTVCPALSFPLEDLYVDGQAPGQVGQEIYGAGGAMAFAIRSHHHVEDAPFLLYCNQFLRARDRAGPTRLTINLDGGEGCEAELALVRLPRRTLPQARVRTALGETIAASSSSPDRTEYTIPANGRIILDWG